LIFILTYSNSDIIIGAQSVKPTTISKGTKFASPHGTGSGLNKETPSSLQYAMKHLKGGDVLFLRGGVYKFNMLKMKKFRIYKNIDGTEENPTIIESFPGEYAILDGSSLNRKDNKERKEGGILVYGNYTKIRNIEVRNMPEHGISVEAKHVTVEGCLTHHNGLSGINASFSDNIILKNNISHHNSDVNLGHKKWNYDNGNNADGISLTYSKNSTIQHNTVYMNSDDGIDLWGSSYCLVEYNKVYKNGYLDNGEHAGIGNGEGIKSGGINGSIKGENKPKTTHNNVISHNLVWGNYNNGIVSSEKTNIDLTYKYNTTWDNGHVGPNSKKIGRGYTANKDTVVYNNISYNDVENDRYSISLSKNNSWDKEFCKSSKISFLNTKNIQSTNFLKPTKKNHCNDIGAYANENNIIK
jgi:hypothetical protein